MADGGVAARVSAVIGAVAAQAVRDAGARGIVLLHDGSPEAELARDWLSAAIGGDGVWPVPAPDADAARAAYDAVRPGSGAEGDAPAPATLIAQAHRLAARCVALDRHGLVADPANKTALLLGGRVPAEPLLPLGDLYASQVAELAGDWSAPPATRKLIDAAGGIAAVDAALIRRVDERRPPAEAFGPLPDGGRAVRSAFDAGRFHRRRVGIVPKLGRRTLGIDLFG